MAIHFSVLAWRISWTEELGEVHTVHGITKSRTRLRDCPLRFMIRSWEFRQGHIELYSHHSHQNEEKFHHLCCVVHYILYDQKRDFDFFLQSYAV